MAVISNGTTLINNGALDSGVASGDLVLLSTQTASSSSSISFTSDIDSTYDSYIFKFYNIHPATNDVTFNFNASTDGGSNYNVTKTTSFWVTRHREGDSATNLDYVDNRDLAQSTDFQKLNYDVGNLSDEDVSGTLQIFKPSDTTFIKQFVSRAVGNGQAEDCQDSYVAGYFNTSSALNAFRFQMSSGNIDSGTIKMYGVAS